MGERGCMNKRSKRKMNIIGIDVSKAKPSWIVHGLKKTTKSKRKYLPISLKAGKG
jgi:hypothetical protein